MIHIYGKYYCDSDGVRNFTLYKSSIVNDVKKAKEENLGKTRYESIGFFSNIESMMTAMTKDMVHALFAKANDNPDEIIELKEILREIKAIEKEIVEQLDIGAIKEMLKEEERLNEAS